MGIVLQLLLSLLPQLLKWLMDLLKKNQQVNGRQLDQLNRIVWYCGQVGTTSPQVGATVGGTPPPVSASQTDPLDTVSGSFLEGWIVEFLLKNGKELGLKLVRDFLIPWLKVQAQQTQNRFDDYAVKQLEKVVTDPEFIALMEDVS